MKRKLIIFFNNCILIVLLFVIALTISYSQQFQRVKACSSQNESIDTLISGKEFLYFTLKSNIETTLWVTDGTEANNKSISFDGIFLKPLTINENKLFFVTKNSSSKSIWVSNGLENKAEKIFSFTEYGNTGDTAGIYLLGTVKNKTYFLIDWFTDSIWVTDGTRDGTKNTGINLQPNNSKYFDELRLVAQIENKFVFLYGHYNYNSANHELYLSDGTPEGTTQIHQFTYKEPFSGFIKHNNVFYTSLTTEKLGNELYRLDFDSSKLVLIKDISPGKNNSNVRNYLIIRDTLFFLVRKYVNDQPISHLWKTDGTESGTEYVTSFPLIEIENNNGAIFKAKNDRYCFVANDSIYGEELWVTDGTKEGSGILNDINPGPEWSIPVGFFPFGGKLAFIAGDDIQRNIWITDGTKEGTHPLLYDFKPGYMDYSNDVNGKLFINLSYGSENNLYCTDGTDEGTRLLLSGSTSYRIPIVFHSKAYFSSNNKRERIWESDGTIEGTKPILGAYGDYEYDGTVINNRSGFIVFNNTLFCKVRVTFNNYEVYELWKLTFPTDVKDSISNYNLVIYPNPANDYINADLSGLTEFKSAKIQLIDLNGKILQNIENNKKPVQIDISGLTAGSYFLIINNDNKRSFLKFIKK